MLVSAAFSVVAEQLYILRCIFVARVTSRDVKLLSSATTEKAAEKGISITFYAMMRMSVDLPAQGWELQQKPPECLARRRGG